MKITLKFLTLAVCAAWTFVAHGQSQCREADADGLVASVIERAQALSESGKDAEAVASLQLAVQTFSQCDQPAYRAAINRLDYEQSLFLVDMPGGGPKAMGILQKVLARTEVSSDPSDRRVLARSLKLQSDLLSGASRFEEAQRLHLKAGRLFGNDLDPEVAAVAAETIAGSVRQLVSLKRCQEARTLIKEFEVSRMWAPEPFARLATFSAGLAKSCE